ncbi:MAG: DNA topoisomerase IB [Planctomycetes bacterium]|nr:DNA topoisomerase IB [Planctomycetota bacterium]MBI3844814.1 DNA topoisomerase IB [Planctomycetota bacterium]
MDEKRASDAIAATAAAGLRCVFDRDPGIRRLRVGDEFQYVSSDGERIGDFETLARIRSIAIPPAWTDVWICPTASGHIQATGRDAKHRKQYRYHPSWCERRNETKFGRMLAFGKALKRVRKRTARDLRRRGLPREKVLAVVTKLLEQTFIRIGNSEYRRLNDSYGLTTLRARHVSVTGSRLRFQFRGKSGKQHVIDLFDRKIAATVKRCRELPGYELFQYVDEDGKRQKIDSGDVNEYLRQITGRNFTAKDFRTWGGTVMAARMFAELGPATSKSDAKRKVVACIKRVAENLGNTTTVCRRYYVHPAIVEAYEGGSLLKVLEQEKMASGYRASGSGSIEAAVFEIIERWTESSPESTPDDGSSNSHSARTRGVRLGDHRRRMPA